MSEHYFTKKPTSPLQMTLVSYLYKGYQLSFTCASGVFSAKRIDTATALLLKHAILVDGWDVLDIGCGNGIIGISIKKAYPNCHVTLSDINKRALYISRKNALLNEVSVKILESDVYNAIGNRVFATIITNPPHHAGRDIIYNIIDEAPAHLKANGMLQIVAWHNKGGKMLEKKMLKVFGNVNVLAKKGGIRVYCSEVRKWQKIQKNSL